MKCKIYKIKQKRIKLWGQYNKLGRGVYFVFPKQPKTLKPTENAYILKYIFQNNERYIF